mmetsp:Transcript_4386/g.10087  ORF Transcript_4386/g.10087 Transcript_4386/m.10087 type:complete len:250 (+) Transcript_4386:260-1009(+)
MSQPAWNSFSEMCELPSRSANAANWSFCSCVSGSCMKAISSCRFSSDRPLSIERASSPSSRKMSTGSISAGGGPGGGGGGGGPPPPPPPPGPPPRRDRAGRHLPAARARGALDRQGPVAREPAGADRLHAAAAHAGAEGPVRRVRRPRRQLAHLREGVPGGLGHDARHLPRRGRGGRRPLQLADLLPRLWVPVHVLRPACLHHDRPRRIPRGRRPLAVGGVDPRRHCRRLRPCGRQHARARGGRGGHQV